ncbi:MAG: hypothetical protein H6667_05405 [Ardenticatenaceae bacterium]|nr:hypothetical protein [Ardenticatenaceae bacterium]
MIVKGKIFFSLLLVISILIVACNKNTTPDKTPKMELVVTPSSVASDKGALIGQIVSVTDSTPLLDTEVRLAKIFWDETKEQGAYVIEGGSSPTTITDANGRFVFNDLDLQDYAIVVGDLYGQYEVLSQEDGSAQIFTPKVGVVEDIGVIKVNLEVGPSQTSTIESYPAPLYQEAQESYP